MSMVSGVVGGVDTQADVHVAAAIDGNGGVSGIEAESSCAAGSRQCRPRAASLSGDTPTRCRTSRSAAHLFERRPHRGFGRDRDWNPCLRAGEV